MISAPLSASLLLALAWADIYVDGSAANCATATGTEVDPLCSIGDAIALANPGDTIRIAPGRYSEQIVITKDLELIGTGGDEMTIIDGAGAGGSVVTIPNAVDATLDGLTVTGGVSNEGGGIRVLGSLFLRNSTVSGNLVQSPYYAAAEGGGIFARGQGVHVELENSTVRDNEVVAGKGGTGQGGGVFVQDGTLVIRNSTIDGNRANAQYKPSANTRGGGILVFRTSLIMSGSTLSNNVIAGLGGGLYSLVSPFHVTNSTVSGNTALRGSAIYKFAGNSIGSLDHVTITKNNRTLSTLPAVIGDMTIQNSIIAGNNENLPFNILVHSPDLGDGTVSLGNNVFGVAGSNSPALVAGDSIGDFAAPLDPMLAPLQDNGGPTYTHAVLPGSPALDAANPIASQPVDQRGLIRPQGSGPDIGAFELESFTSLCNGDGGDQLGCTDCPCANNAAPGTPGGCLNSVGNSALLSASGDTSVSQPALSTIDLRFGIAGVPPNSYCILNSGSAVAPNTPSSPCFGQNSGIASIEFNGLRCAILNTRRAGGRAADVDGAVGVTNAPWGGEGAPPAGLANAFGGFSAGETRYFQALYREDASALCMLGLNTSQAIEVVFAP